MDKAIDDVRILASGDAIAMEVHDTIIMTAGMQSYNGGILIATIC